MVGVSREQPSQSPEMLLVLWLPDLLPQSRKWMMLAGPSWLDGQDVRNGSHLGTFEPCNTTINRWREPITTIISEKMTTGKTLILKHNINRDTNWNINYGYWDCFTPWLLIFMLSIVVNKHHPLKEGQRIFSSL